MKRWLVLALLLPLLAAAEEPQFGSLEDLEKVLLPGTYRCMPWSDQQVESSSTSVPLFIPNGWSLSAHTVFSEEPANGLMLELDYLFTERLRLRLGSGVVLMNRQSTLGDIRFEEQMQMNQFGLYLDWRLLEATDLGVVGGVVWHNTSVDITATPTPGLIYSLNGRLYTSAQLGVLSGELNYAPQSPYLGIAWRKQLGWNSRWSFSADLGTIFNMSPELSLRSDSTITGINSDLAVEANELESEFDDRFITATLGLSYAF